MITLPGLIDVHVHMRQPGATHKEDWDSGTSAALAGGITLVLAMPNTSPPIFDRSTLDVALSAAETSARCDYAQFVGAGPQNAPQAARLAPRSAGVKMYLDMTYGQLRLDDMTLWQQHFAHWPAASPLVVHAEGRTMAAAILFAAMYNRPIHIAHVSSREEILTIRAAKEAGIQVTCEVTPHHLFLSQEDFPSLSQGGRYPGRQEVRPRLACTQDVQALWENLEVIDIFATDHAPHTLGEKDSDSPPPGFPGLETVLPLLLTAVHRGQLTLDDVITRMHENPQRIFNLPPQPETWVTVDPDAVYEIRARDSYSRCGWTPFEGWQVRGRVQSVILRGQTVYQDGVVTASPGYGQDVRRA
jgi:carbamoyl-phosphate synthase/aspartate carbamoyltransferase/dihydroorotase